MAEAAAQSRLLALPPEIREEIYRLLLAPAANRVELEDEYARYEYAPILSLFRVNRLIYHEARKVFRDLNTFISIATPWDQAQQHVFLEGHVPIVVSGERARRFTQARLAVHILAPGLAVPERPNEPFVILLDDLDAFTQTWCYADLSYPQVNGHLCLSLSLRDPYAASYDEPRISKALQRRLLLPFGRVKNLQDTKFDTSGPGAVSPFTGIVSELRTLQQTPHASPESCLAEATRLKTSGNALLTAGDPRGALRLYTAAWRALHVVVHGRQRHVHADQFFQRILTDAPYAGKNGQAERLVLRVHLVANTCLAYLQLRDPASCIHWGTRTIGMLRQAMGLDERGAAALAPHDEAILTFPAAPQMGKIYYRTGLAYQQLGDNSSARKLFAVAREYLPQDESVKKAVAAVALPLM